MVETMAGAAKLVAVVAVVAAVPVAEGDSFAPALTARVVAVGRTSRSRRMRGAGFVALTAALQHDRKLSKVDRRASGGGARGAI